MTTLMLLPALLVCAWEHERWMGLLVSAHQGGEGVPRGASGSLEATVDLRIWRVCGVAVLFPYLTSCVLAGGIYRPRGLDLGRPEFYVFPLIACLPLLAWAWERRRLRQAL